MKKTVTCLAMIVSATAFAKKDEKTENRAPAAVKPGYTYAGCQPRGQYTGSEEYRNRCMIPLQEVEVDEYTMGRPMKVKVPGCDPQHVMVVSATPIFTRCIPPGAVEL